MDWSTVIQILVALLGAGGLAGWRAVWLKARHEADAIAVTTAAEAVKLQADLAAALREEMVRIRADHEDCRRNEADLRRHVELLEERVGELEQLVLKHGGEP